MDPTQATEDEFTFEVETVDAASLAAAARNDDALLVNGPRLVLLDADMVAGWRRSTPSLAQLHQAILHLERQHPDVQVTVIGDPSIKWALNASEQAAFDGDIVGGVIVCGPAGTVDGSHGFFTAVVAKAIASGRPVVAITDRALRDVPLGRVTCVDNRWMFTLEGKPSAVATTTRPARRKASTRRRRSSAA